MGISIACKSGNTSNRPYWIGVSFDENEYPEEWTHVSDVSVGDELVNIMAPSVMYLWVLFDKGKGNTGRQMYLSNDGTSMGSDILTMDIVQPQKLFRLSCSKMTANKYYFPLYSAYFGSSTNPEPDVGSNGPYASESEPEPTAWTPTKTVTFSTQKSGSQWTYKGEKLDELKLGSDGKKWAYWKDAAWVEFELETGSYADPDFYLVPLDGYTVDDDEVDSVSGLWTDDDMNVYISTEFLRPQYYLGFISGNLGDYFSRLTDGMNFKCSNSDVDYYPLNKPTVYYYAKYVLDHCTQQWGYNEYKENDYTNAIKLTLETGYEFKTLPTIIMGDVTMEASHKDDDPETVYWFEAFQVTADFTMTAKGTPIGGGEEEKNNADFGFINIYNPTIEELKQAGKSIFITSGGGVENITQYIVDMYMTWITPDCMEKQESIMYGSLDTGVGSNVVKEQTKTVSCGKLVVDEKFKSALDYKGTDIRLYLPFIGFVSLDATVVVGTEISIDYTLDVLTGRILVEVKFSRLNDEPVVYQWSGDCRMSIPYYTRQGNDYSNQIQNEVLNVGGKVPYLLIERSQDKTPAKEYGGQKTHEWVKLGDCTGFCQFDRVDLYNFDCGQSEMNELDALLKKGVIL